MEKAGYTQFVITKDGKGTTTVTVAESLWDSERGQPQIAAVMHEMNIEDAHTEMQFWFYPSIICELPEGNFDI